ncbi:hypothetical protein GUJ93_ZPchr0002g25273 [Zizania palustris]|uniref:Uncharacterized protein n=1 Tax=Zizania palustris TaxID=103762 RepID=A0A8J5VUF3_ZIZPA|nr:hypothetical protein GUJ93_ZPchr0002g25273 [Zizania palustris]
MLLIDPTVQMVLSKTKVCLVNFSKGGQRSQASRALAELEATASTAAAACCSMKWGSMVGVALFFFVILSETWGYWRKEVSVIGDEQEAVRKEIESV